MATILVVDDEEVDRELARRSLDSIEGLEIRFAANGYEALEMIAARPPDVVLTDLRMPGMDGLELVETIRERNPRLPVLLMTGRGSEEIAVRALRAGAATYVSKSSLKTDLADTVDKVLEIGEAKRSRRKVLANLGRTESRFTLENDPDLIYALVGYLQESLERLEFGNEYTRTQIGIALAEALSNAMIHGNLEVSSELRQNDRDAFNRLVRERRTEEPYARRRVHVTAIESPERVEYVIRDEGRGFDPSSLPDPTMPQNLVGVAGRGVLLIRTFMDRVDYNDRGNQITMAKTNRPETP